ncbi:DUF6221 family protein [Streptomyces sp. NPDC005775]|uniref:DUF6221 family protein n=1 Tax=Streptomyces sp. NPDC005775 TaxID=3364729 RepID=UPI003688B7B4
MTDLVQFLRDRLAEDERIARAACHARVAPSPWRGESWDDAVLDGDGVVDAKGDGVALVKGELIRAHIIEHDPARVLRDIDAKRRILDEIVPAMDGMDDRIDSEWGVGPMDPSEYESVGLLRLLALSYVDHADYREEWRP